MMCLKILARTSEKILANNWLEPAYLKMEPKVSLQFSTKHIILMKFTP